MLESVVILAPVVLMWYSSISSVEKKLECEQRTTSVWQHDRVEIVTNGQSNRKARKYMAENEEHKKKVDMKNSLEKRSRRWYRRQRLTRPRARSTRRRQRVLNIHVSWP